MSHPARSHLLSALRGGARLVASAPAVLGGVYLALLASAVPFAVTLGTALARHLGSSLEAERAATGVNWDWWQEFLGQADGLAATFTPAILGFAAPLGNLSRLLDEASLPVAGWLAVGVFGACWLGLWGGVLARYARARPLRVHGFFAASGVFFFRFLRLALLAAPIYWVLLGPAHRWIFDALYDWLTADLPSEQATLTWRLLLYGMFLTVLILVNVVFDYAKIRAVVEDRRSMLGALLAGARFVRRHPRDTLGLYLTNGVLFLLLLGLYAVVAPGAEGSGLRIAWVFLLGQAYILGRLALRLVFAASQVCLFQGRLAHAGYTAGPQAVWPESPMAEALANAPAAPFGTAVEGPPTQ